MIAFSGLMYGHLCAEGEFWVTSCHAMDVKWVESLRYWS